MKQNSYSTDFKEQAQRKAHERGEKTLAV